MTWMQLEGILSEFGNNTKLEGSIEGKEALQGNKLKFNKDMCQILHLAWGSPECTHRLGNEMLEGSTTERTWGSWLIEN